MLSPMPGNFYSSQRSVPQQQPLQQPPYQQIGGHHLPQNNLAPRGAAQLPHRPGTAAGQSGGTLLESSRVTGSGRGYGSQRTSDPPKSPMGFLATPQTGETLEVGGRSLRRASLTDLIKSGNLMHNESRTIDAGQLTDEHQVISERFQDSEIKVPRKVMKEEVRETVVVVPETVRVEEIVEEVVKIREKIIEVARPVYQEKIVEVPEIEYVERVVEVPEVVYEERIVEVPKVEVIERVNRKPKIVYKEKIVEVPEYEYREVDAPNAVTVEVDQPVQIVEDVHIREVPVDKIVDVEVPEYRVTEVEENVERYLPVPVEAVTYYQFKLPKVTTKFQRKEYPVYAPRFIEVPIPTSAIASEQLNDVNFMHQTVTALCHNQNPSLCEVEKIADFVRTKSTGFNFQVNQADLQRKFDDGSLLNPLPTYPLPLHPPTAPTANTMPTTMTAPSPVGSNRGSAPPSASLIRIGNAVPQGYINSEVFGRQPPPPAVYVVPS